MKKLQIVFLDFDDIRNPLLGAGHAKSTYEVGKRLVKKGHSVTVLSGKYPGYKDRIEAGIEYKHISVGSNNIKFNNAMYILTVPFYISQLKADIILECFTAPISTLFSQLWTKIPVVARPTSFEADRFSKLYHLPFTIIEKLGCRLYKYFLPFSFFLEEKMRKLNPDITCAIVPEGIEDAYFQLKRKTAKHILFIGRYDIGQKGLDLLLEAFAKVAKKIGYPLVIAGRGPDENKIKQTVIKMKLEKYVKVAGPKFGKQKEELLSRALFAVIPSRHEGFSIFALEALAAGVPLVAFDIPGLACISDEAVMRASKFDINEFANLMIKATNAELNSQMSHEARNLAKNYSWYDVAEKFEKFFYHVDYINNSNMNRAENYNNYFNFIGRKALKLFLSLINI